MTSIAQELLARANEVAEQLDARSSELKKELLNIQLRARQIEARLDATDMANKRLLDYRPALGPDYQCPDCFIKNEARVALRPILGSNTHDVFKCPTCEVDIAVFVDR